MNLEMELKQALRRQSPPAGFAARVMQQIELDECAQVSKPALRPWRAVAAAGLMTLFLGGWAVREAALQRAAGERAREQVLLALGITGEKLREVRSHVRDIGSPQD